MSTTNDLSPLDPDVKLVIEGKEPITLDRWFIHILAKNEKVETIKILNIDIQEYYDDHYSEIRTVDIMMGRGQYSNVLYPGRDDIVVNLIRADANKIDYDSYEGIQGVTENEFYKGTLVDLGNEVIDDRMRTITDTDGLDLSGVMIVRLQLQNKADEQIRLVKIGGTYRDCTLDQVISAVITDAIKSIETEQDFIPSGVEMIPPDNTTEYEQIIVPDGLMLVDLLGYLQNTYGIYNTGLSHYIRSGTWYVFPTYDVRLGKKTASNMQVSMVSNRQYPLLGRTYRRFGSTTMVIANGERRVREPSVKQLANEGNGVTFLDPTSYFDGMVDTQTDPNKAILDSSLVVNDFVAVPNDSGINNVPIYGDGVTANKQKVLSDLASRSGSYIEVIWNFSSPELALPGTSANIRYVDNGEVKEVEGVLIRTYHGGQLYGTGLTATDYWYQTMLSFYITRDIGLQDQQE